MVFRNQTRWFSFALILGLGLAGTSSSPAVNYNVFSGQSIQTKINTATNGDTIVIFNGFYSENLTVKK